MTPILLPKMWNWINFNSSCYKCALVYQNGIPGHEDVRQKGQFLFDKASHGSFTSLTWFQCRPTILILTGRVESPGSATLSYLLTSQQKETPHHWFVVPVCRVYTVPTTTQHFRKSHSKVLTIPDTAYFGVLMRTGALQYCMPLARKKTSS